MNGGFPTIASKPHAFHKHLTAGTPTASGTADVLTGAWRQIRFEQLARDGPHGFERGPPRVDIFVVSVCFHEFVATQFSPFPRERIAFLRRLASCRGEGGTHQQVAHQPRHDGCLFGLPEQPMLSLHVGGGEHRERLQLQPELQRALKQNLGGLAPKGNLLHFVLLLRETKGLDLVAPRHTEQRVAASDGVVKKSEGPVALEGQQCCANRSPARGLRETGNGRDRTDRRRMQGARRDRARCRRGRRGSRPAGGERRRNDVRALLRPGGRQPREAGRAGYPI